MKIASPLATALACAALAAAAVAQQQKVPGARAHSPRLGKPAAHTTGATPAAIKRASGGGVPHGPRAGDGKVKPTSGNVGKATPAR